MTNNSKNEIWVFLSHSNKDYEKVIKVRDLLEKNSFRPLMFFLKCLNDDDELDDLIKREIDSRGRFILCDSENARNSKWVKREVEYIKSKQRVYQTIDIDASVEDIAASIIDFKKKSSVYVSYARKDRAIYEQLTDFLKQDWEFRINEYEDELGASYSKSIQSNINKALSDGYVIFLITDNYLKSEWCRKELSHVCQMGRGQDKNIIVFMEHPISTKAKVKGLIPYYNREWHDEVGFSFENNSLTFDKLEVYFTFMSDMVKDRVAVGDDVAIEWLKEYAEKLYKEGLYWYNHDDNYSGTVSAGLERASLTCFYKAASLGLSDAKAMIENGYWTVNKEDIVREVKRSGWDAFGMNNYW